MMVRDWKIGERVAGTNEAFMPRPGKAFPVFEFQAPATRRATYYLYKIVSPLCMIAIMSWLVFWIEASELPLQLALAATSMLTLIAFQFSMNDLLSKSWIASAAGCFAQPDASSFSQRWCSDDNR